MDPIEALAEPARRRILDILASGEHTAGQIADVVGFEFHISRTAVSKHLRHLRDAHLVDVRADLQWRWYRVDKAGFDALELMVADLRLKMLSAVGWDADAHRDHDPLRVAPVYPAVGFKGPGRAPRRGKRGRQTEFTLSADPDTGLFPVYPIPDRAAFEVGDPSDDDPRDDDPSDDDPHRLEA